MKKLSKKPKKAGKTRSMFSVRYTPSFVGFSVMLAISMYIIYVLSVFSLGYEPPVRRQEQEPVLVEVLAPYTEKVEPKKAQEEKNGGKYKVNKDVKAQVATGDAKTDEDAGAAPVKDNTVSVSEIKPEVTRDISSVSPVGSPTVFESAMTGLTFASVNTTQGWNIIANNLYYVTPEHSVLLGNQMVDSVRYYFNERGAKASLVGIDVSRHQGSIDWQKVRQAGIDFAIIRVGFRGYGKKGTLNIDDNFHKNISGALNAGIRVGLYFYSQAVTVQEAVDEASVAVQQASGYNVTFPIYCDTEFAQTDRSGRADRLDYDVRTDCVEAFCETVRQAGYIPGVYASKSFFYHQLDFSRLSGYQTWLAHYTKDMTDFGYPYQVWQYTDSAHVWGITQNTVDLNIAYYDYTYSTDMSSYGDKTLLYSDYSEIEPYYTAEAMINEYLNVRTDDYYLQTASQVEALPLEFVKNKYKQALELRRLAVMAQRIFGVNGKEDEQTTSETEN